MSARTSGYVNYPYGYYREMSPPLLSLAVLNRNISASHSRVPRYLELGFGARAVAQHSRRRVSGRILGN